MNNTIYNNILRKVLLATSNRGKLEEFQDEINKWEIELIFQEGLEFPEENGLTFVENALIKARSGALQTGLSCLADDSGIVVPELAGQPGIYSARYASLHNSSLDNSDYLLQQCKDLVGEQRRAYFYVCLVLVNSVEDPTPLIAIGKVDGYLTTEKRGTNGHGYDPIFYYPELNKTFAELDIATKNQVSHRAKALRSLKKLIF